VKRNLVRVVIVPTVLVIAAGCEIAERRRQDDEAGTRGAMQDAIQRGDAARVRDLLKANRDLANADIKDGDRALHLAVARGSREIVLALIAARAKVNAKGKGGRRPLHCAETGELIRILIHYRANPDGENDRGETPLDQATARGRRDLANLLRLAGANRWSAASVRVCPNGHRSLKGIPVVSDRLRGSPEYRRKVEALEVWPRGGSGKTTKVVVCATCRFVFDTLEEHWTRSSADPSSFKRPLNPLTRNIPVPALERKVQPTYTQRIKDGDRALHLAVARGSREIVLALIAGRPDLDGAQGDALRQIGGPEGQGNDQLLRYRR